MKSLMRSTLAVIAAFHASFFNFSSAQAATQVANNGNIRAQAYQVVEKNQNVQFLNASLKPLSTAEAFESATTGNLIVTEKESGAIVRLRRMSSTTVGAEMISKTLIERLNSSGQSERAALVLISSKMSKAQVETTLHDSILSLYGDAQAKTKAPLRTIASLIEFKKSCTHAVGLGGVEPLAIHSGVGGSLAAPIFGAFLIGILVLMVSTAPGASKVFGAATAGVSKGTTMLIVGSIAVIILAVVLAKTSAGPADGTPCDHDDNK